MPSAPSVLSSTNCKSRQSLGDRRSEERFESIKYEIEIFLNGK